VQKIKDTWLRKQRGHRFIERLPLGLELLQMPRANCVAEASSLSLGAVSRRSWASATRRIWFFCSRLDAREHCVRTRSGARALGSDGIFEAFLYRHTFEIAAAMSNSSRRPLGGVCSAGVHSLARCVGKEATKLVFFGGNRRWQGRKCLASARMLRRCALD